MTTKPNRPTPAERRARHNDRFAPGLLRPSHILLRNPVLFALSIGFTVTLGLLAAFNREVLLSVDRGRRSGSAPTRTRRPSPVAT